jgi:hypothetical protein
LSTAPAATVTAAASAKNAEETESVPNLGRENDFSRKIPKEA